MKLSKSSHRIVPVFILAIFLLSFTTALSDDKNEMPRRHKDWIEKEVRWITTKEEKEAFYQLDTNELRDQFIKIFWEKRDPTPGTFENEFKVEHARRIKHANQFFGPHNQANGWRSERGRIYIMYGEPKQRLEYPSNTIVYPLELWFYSADDRVEGITFFYVMFFQRGGAGDYVLYHPKMDGPAALAWKGNFDFEDSEIMEALTNLNPEIARASISLNPFDPNNPLSSEVLLGKVDNYAEANFDGSWAKLFVDSKGKVDVSYTFKNKAISSLINVFSHPTGQQLHFAFLLLPEEIEIGLFEDNYFAAFQFLPSIADMDGNIIFEGDSTTEFSWTKKEFETMKSKPIMVADFLPIIPGEYTFTLRVRNKVSKSYFMISKTVNVPLPEAETFYLDTPLLTYKTEKVTTGEKQISPFRYFIMDFTPSITHEFANIETVNVFTQLYYPPMRTGNKRIGEVTFTFNLYSEDKLVKKFTHIYDQSKIRPQGVIYLSYPIPLDGLDVGEYRLELIATEKNFGLSDRKAALLSLKDPSTISRENVIRLHQNIDPDDPQFIMHRAEQLAAAGIVEPAINLLKKVLSRDRNNINAAIQLGELHQKNGDHQEALSVFNSVVHNEPNNRDLVMLMASSNIELGDVSKAASYYDRLLYVYPKDIEILNKAASIYRQLGNMAKAKEYLKKSLELEANQPAILEIYQKLNE